MKIIESASAAVRLDAARRFLLDSPPGTEVLIVVGIARRRRRLRARACADARRDVRPLPLQPDPARRTPRGAAARARTSVADHRAGRSGRRGAGACSTPTPTRRCPTSRRWRRCRDFRARSRARSRSWRSRWSRRRGGAPVPDVGGRSRGSVRACSTSSFSRRRRSIARRSSAPRPRGRRPAGRRTRAAACCCSMCR